MAPLGGPGVALLYDWCQQRLGGTIGPNTCSLFVKPELCQNILGVSDPSEGVFVCVSVSGTLKMTKGDVTLCSKNFLEANTAHKILPNKGRGIFLFY